MRPVDPLRSQVLLPRTLLFQPLDVRGHMGDNRFYVTTGPNTVKLQG